MAPLIIAALISAAIEAGKIGYDYFKEKPKNPAKKAEPWLEKAGDIYKPYMEQGQEAYDVRNPIFNQRAQDPIGQYNQLMSGYQESPGYQKRRENALTAAGNSAAAGGMRGGLQDMSNESQIADALLQGDMGDWYNKVYGMQNSGLEGLGDIYNKGYSAASDLANNYGNRGNLDMLGQIYNNQQKQSSQNNMTGSMSDIAGMLSKIDWTKLLGNAPQGDVYQQRLNLGGDYSTPNQNMNMYPWMR